MIPYGKQEITQQDVDAVVDVLNSNFLTQGPQVPLFEQAIKDATNAEYALAVNSATSALHIPCLALGVTQGDSVWTTPSTFVASSNCALYCGAEVDFVDFDPQTYNLCPDKLAKKLAHAKANNLTLPKVVIPVHLCGQPFDMQRIYRLSQECGFAIIEDSSHAIGGKYQDKPIGNCQYSDITVFSFHPVKIVTTAEQYNLRTIPDIAARFDVLSGLSDHTIDNATAIASVALGACLIEKHVTLDRSGGGADDSFSLEPKELEQLCTDSKTAWLSLGQVSYERSEAEKGNVKFRRSLYVVKDIAAGELLTNDNVKSIRPSFGLPPKHLPEVIGKTAIQSIAKGTALAEGLFE